MLPMTQNYIKVITIFCFIGLAFSIFQLPTLIFLILTLFSSYLYFKALFHKYLSKGLIDILPQSIQDQLLHQSIFDILCKFWFESSFKFVKLIFRPFIQQVDPDHPMEALHDVDPQTKKKYLEKGVVKIMPQYCQKILLGNERMIELHKERQQQVFFIQKPIFKQITSQQNTDDQSEQQIPRIKKTNKFYEQGQKNEEQSETSINRQVRKGSQKDVSKFQKKIKKQNIFQVIQNSINMIKRIVQFQNVNGQIQKLNTTTIIKLMIIFWVILLLQVKFNKRARKIVFKIFYIFGGIITVFGAVGTTGILVYKEWQKNKEIKKLQIQN